MPESDNEAEGDQVHPFHNDHHWTCYNLAKASICLVMLVPLRLCLLVVAIILASIFTIIASQFLPTSKAGKEEPLPPIIPPLLWPIRLALRLTLLSFGFWWITIRDERSKTSKMPSIIVGNHVSIMDIIFMGYYFSPSIVGKSSLAKAPLIGRMGRLAQTIFVTRDDPESRAAAREAIQVRVSSPGFQPLLIFPEGTCTNGQCLITFQQGAFLPGLPVLPVILQYPHRHFNPSKCGSAGRNPFLMLLQFANYLHVTILEPYSPNEEERKSPVLFAHHVQDLYQAKLGVPTVDTKGHACPQKT